MKFYADCGFCRRGKKKSPQTYRISDSVRAGQAKVSDGSKIGVKETAPNEAKQIFTV